MAAYISVPSDPMARKMKKKATVSKRQRAQMELAEKKTKGFKANAKKIAAKQDVPLERAQAILAAGTRKASPAAKKANPALKKVKGKAKK